GKSGTNPFYSTPLRVLHAHPAPSPTLVLRPGSVARAVGGRFGRTGTNALGRRRLVLPEQPGLPPALRTAGATPRRRGASRGGRAAAGGGRPQRSGGLAQR